MHGLGTVRLLGGRGVRGGHPKKKNGKGRGGHEKYFSKTFKQHNVLMLRKML